LRVLENMMLQGECGYGPQRDEVIGDWRKLRAEEFHNSYSSPIIITMLKSRWMEETEHVSRFGDIRNYYKIVISKFEGRSRDSSVDIATGYGLDDQGVGVWVPVSSRIFSSPRRPDRLWGPPSLLSNGYKGAVSPVLKRPERETDHSPPTSAEVRKCGSIHPLLIRLHGVVLK
jgi:hypothetical protein